MKKWGVTLERVVKTTATIYADSQEQAEEVAKSSLYPNLEYSWTSTEKASVVWSQEIT